MHPNPAFSVEDRALQEQWIEKVGFGMIFAQAPAGPRVAHVPIQTAGDGRLHFHLSRGNALVSHLDGNFALAVINGPDAYISPQWYADRMQVPTWNYVAIECEGRVRKLPAESLTGHIEELVARYEARTAGSESWKLDRLPQERLHKMQKGIVGFEMEISDLRSTFKLSQNKDDADREGVIAALVANGSHELAGLMRECRK